jgi:hypothetical protein
MSFFKKHRKHIDISDEVSDTILSDESYIDNKSYDSNAIRPYELDGTDVENAVVFRRYLPDVMTWYVHVQVIRRYPDMAIPILENLKR